MNSPPFASENTPESHFVVWFAWTGTKFREDTAGVLGTQGFLCPFQEQGVLTKTVQMTNVHLFVPAIPQSEVLAKNMQEISKKCGEILAKFFADYRSSISRESPQKNSLKILDIFHCAPNFSFGTAATLGAGGPNICASTWHYRKGFLFSKQFDISWQIQIH